MGGKLSCFPDWYPLNPKHFFDTKQEADNFSAQQYFRSQNNAQRLAKKYDIASLIAINQLMPVSVADWFGLSEDIFYKHYGLPDAIKKAIAFEVTRIGEERSNNLRKQEQEAKMARENFNGQLNFGSSNSTIQKLFR